MGGANSFQGPSGVFAAPNPELEKNVLRNRADALRGELEQIKSRLENMEKEAPKE
jgi:hypothetical protein